MEEWVNITTIDQGGLYEVELNIYTSKTRHRKLYLNGIAGPWEHGEPDNKSLHSDGQDRLSE